VVITSIPANGEKDIDVWYPRINIYFSEELDPKTVNENTVTMKDSLGNPIDFYAHYLMQDYGIQVRRGSSHKYLALDNNSTYTVTIGTGVTDRASNYLETPYEFSFTTVASEGNSIPQLDRVRRKDVARIPDGVEFDFMLYCDDRDWSWPGEIVDISFTDSMSTWVMGDSSDNWTYEYQTADEQSETIEEGNQTITFSLQDTADNTVSKQVDVFVFSATPVITAPGDSDVVALPVEVSWGSVDNAELYEVTFYNGPDTETATKIWQGFLADDGGTSYSLSIPDDVTLQMGQSYYVDIIARNGVTGCGSAGPSRSELVSFSVGADSDKDGLSDSLENTACTDVNNADTDNDGILDGDEDANHNGKLDTGETDPCDIDSYGDGIQDGTELGYTSGDIGTDTDTGVFQPDLDPTTTTDPLNSDTNGNGLNDGEEDTNHNGMVDAGETDPSAVISDGDVAPLGNRDGQVNVGDALVALRFALLLETPTQEDMQHGDVAPLDINGKPDPDGQITVGDALVILRKALKLIEF